MTKIITWSRPALTVAAAAALLSGGAAVASAAPLASAAAGGTAPACIARYVYDLGGSTSYARITNNCGKTVRVQVIWDWAQDSSCYSLGAGKVFTASSNFGSYNRTIVC